MIASTQAAVAHENGLRPADPALIEAVSQKIGDTLAELAEMVCGFSFGTVMDAYWRGIKTGDEPTKQSALRWLRGEYTTKTEARRDLGVDAIIDDQNWYDFLKLFALFVTKAGYQGLQVFLDEGANLYKITNQPRRVSRFAALYAGTGHFGAHGRRCADRRA